MVEVSNYFSLLKISSLNLCIKDRDLGTSDRSWYLNRRLDIAVTFLSGFQTSNVSKKHGVSASTGLLSPGTSHLKQEDYIEHRTEENLPLTEASCFSMTARALALQAR